MGANAGESLGVAPVGPQVTGPIALPGRPNRHLDTAGIAGSQEAESHHTPTAPHPNGEPDPQADMNTHGASDSETKVPHGSMHFPAPHTGG